MTIRTQFLVPQSLTYSIDEIADALGHDFRQAERGSRESPFEAMRQFLGTQAASLQEAFRHVSQWQEKGLTVAVTDTAFCEYRPGEGLVAQITSGRLAPLQPKAP